VAAVHPSCGSTLDANGFNACKIVGSSGFTLFKCKHVRQRQGARSTWSARAPYPGELQTTPSPLPTFFPVTHGKPGTKLGREKLFQGLKP